MCIWKRQIIDSYIGSDHQVTAMQWKQTNKNKKSSPQYTDRINGDKVGQVIQAYLWYSVTWSQDIMGARAMLEEPQETVGSTIKQNCILGFSVWVSPTRSKCEEKEGRQKNSMERNICLIWQAPADHLPGGIVCVRKSVVKRKKSWKTCNHCDPMGDNWNGWMREYSCTE